ncbi:MAG: hypothetical protein ACOYD6_02670 [Limnochordia bacterium]|jgi:hypothetical protein
MKIALMVILSLILAAYEIPYLLHHKMGRELWSFLALLGFATAITVLALMGVTIPNPNQLLVNLSDTIIGWLEKSLN